MSAPNPSLRQVLRSPTLFLAFGFGAGLAPHGPGTWGSLLALPLAAVLIHDPLIFALVTLAITVLGIPICGMAARQLGEHDHGGIVWDEIAGQMLACSPLLFLPPPTNLLSGLGLAFVLFRLFDIAKPWPIRVVDRRVHGGVGIMLDDILAGALAAAVLVMFLQLIG